MTCILEVMDVWNRDGVARSNIDIVDNINMAVDWDPSTSAVDWGLRSRLWNPSCASVSHSLQIKVSVT